MLEHFATKKVQTPCFYNGLYPLHLPFQFQFSFDPYNPRQVCQLEKMNLMKSINVLMILGSSLIVTPISALAASINFVELMDNVIQNQPQQQVKNSIKEIHAANQSLSDSWISGDADIIVHHENDALTDNDDYKNWQVGIEFPIWMPSQKSAQKQLTNSYSNEITAQDIYLRWLASETLRNLVWEYHIAKVEIDAARSALHKSRSLQQKVSQKVNAGESPKIDLILANKVVLEQQNKLIKKQSAFSMAQHNFQSWTQTNSFPKNIQERLLPPKAVDQHPEVIMLSSDIQLSESELKKTRSLKQESPRIFLGAQNDKDKNDENTSLIVEVSIPLGINPRYMPKVAEKKRTIYEKKATLDRAKVKLERAIFKAQQSLATAKQNIIFSKQQYELSKKALAMSEEAYQIGEMNIQNLLLVQQQSDESKLNYELAQAQAGQATAKLNQISGNILGVE